MTLCFNSPTYAFLTDTMLTWRQVKRHICVEANWTLDDIFHNIRCETIIPGSHTPEHVHKFDPLYSSSVRSFLCLVHLPLIKLNIIHKFYGQCHAFSQVHQHEQCPLFGKLYTESVWNVTYRVWVQIRPNYWATPTPSLSFWLFLSKTRKKSDKLVGQIVRQIRPWFVSNTFQWSGRGLQMCDNCAVTKGNLYSHPKILLIMKSGDS